LPEGLTPPLGESSAGSFAFLDVWYEKSENGRSWASYGVGKAKGHPSPLPGFIAEELGDGRASRGKPPIPVPCQKPHPAAIGATRLPFVASFQAASGPRQSAAMSA